MSLRNGNDETVLLGANAPPTDTRVRSLAKALSYRVISSLLTGSIFFGATQRVRMALTLALVDSLVKIVVFYIHERAWVKIAFAQATRARRSESRQRLIQPNLETM